MTSLDNIIKQFEDWLSLPCLDFHQAHPIPGIPASLKMALWLWPHDHIGRCLVGWQLWHSWNRSFKLRSCSLIPLSFQCFHVLDDFLEFGSLEVMRNHDKSRWLRNDPPNPWMFRLFSVISYGHFWPVLTEFGEQGGNASGHSSIHNFEVCGKLHSHTLTHDRPCTMRFRKQLWVYFLQLNGFSPPAPCTNNSEVTGDRRFLRKQTAEHQIVSTTNSSK